MRKDKCKCSGCRACENICPQKCIKIDSSNRKKFVRCKTSKCIECGLCDLVCPHNEPQFLLQPVLGMNAWSLNRRIQRNSSSGGIASTIYDWCLQNNIRCIGVNFDVGYNLKYKFITSQNELNKAVGSKYVYSDMNNIYHQIVQTLKSGEKIVFIGLPCHVSALKKYCNIKKVVLSNLYCVDIVCHGVMMPYFWNEHVMYLENKCNMNTGTNILFRKKQNQYGISIMDTDNIQRDISVNDDAYISMYIRGIYTEACYQCPYAQKNRVGDLTIMDCSTPYNKRARASQYNQSSVLLNSHKGIDIWNQIKDELDYYSYSINEIVNEDNMFKCPTKRPKEYRIIMVLEKVIGYRTTTKLAWGCSNIYRKYIRGI